VRRFNLQNPNIAFFFEAYGIQEGWMALQKYINYISRKLSDLQPLPMRSLEYI
jgi:hypothetical protein